MFKSYINPVERTEADRKLPRLMLEGLLLGGTGLGVLALIFEIAADAFSVAAYQTLLAIHGAEGYHEIAVGAFLVLSVMLFLGIVPAYKAGAYLRPNAGGSGPLVEAIGPPKMRWLSWVGTSLFFMDAILTIIISSISAADVMMLIFPEWAPYRILLAEFFAFFIMAVLVLAGPQRAVPMFLLGGGAFTIFTLIALSIVAAAATGSPEWAFLTDGIVHRLQETGVVEHVIRAQEDLSALGTVAVMQFFFRSMSSAMLGFSGYEMIPASGKHAARPKWKVINTALTLAAIFLIGTGIFQLYAAQQWRIPSTEGYSTLLIEYEIVAAQIFGEGIDVDDIVVTEGDREAAEEIYVERLAEEARGEFELHGEGDVSTETLSREEEVEQIANDLAFARALNSALDGTSGQSLLTLAGVLLAIILLLAQGGGYVGGAAVASNAARLGRLPRFFLDDRIGIIVIWGVSAALIPIIREVVIVESYYAFGFVSAFMITSTTVKFVRDDVLKDRGIDPQSAEAKSLRFAGLRGMIASYIMGIVLVTQKTDALGVIVVLGAALTLFQIYMARGGLKADPKKQERIKYDMGELPKGYACGVQRSFDEARQRGIADLVHDMIATGAFNKFNVEPSRICRLVSYIQNIRPEYLRFGEDDGHHERIPEPSLELETAYQKAYSRRDELLREIESYSHFGIFMYIDKYHQNWVAHEKGRDPATVQQAMLDLLFPLTDHDVIWKEYQEYEWHKIPEPIWQFSRERYQWAKAQWPNLADRITTIWTLQDFGLIPHEVDVTMIVSSTMNDLRKVEIHTHGPDDEDVENDSEQESPSDMPDIE